MSTLPAEQLTVVEFAAKHCAENECLTEDMVRGHVNAIILAALTHNRALWNVGIDSDGRASLIWVSMPAFVWEQLLTEGVSTQKLLTWFGGI